MPLLKKSITINWENQLLFEVSLFRFILFLHFQHLDCYYNEYSVKQTVSLHIVEVAFETLER